MLKKIEYFIGQTSTRILRVAHFLRYLRLGKENGYPICCVLHFSWDVARGEENTAKRRGLIFVGTENVYVPCHFHMRRHSAWTPFYDEPRSQLRLFSDKIGKS